MKRFIGAVLVLLTVILMFGCTQEKKLRELDGRVELTVPQDVGSEKTRTFFMNMKVVVDETRSCVEEVYINHIDDHTIASSKFYELRFEAFERELFAQMKGKSFDFFKQFPPPHSYAGSYRSSVYDRQFVIATGASFTTSFVVYGVRCVLEQYGYGNAS